MLLSCIPPDQNFNKLLARRYRVGTYRFGTRVTLVYFRHCVFPCDSSTSPVQAPLPLPIQAYSMDTEYYQHSPLQPWPLRCNELPQILGSFADSGIHSLLRLIDFGISARLPQPRLSNCFSWRISDKDSTSLAKPVGVPAILTAPFLRGSLLHISSGDMFDFALLVVYSATMVLVYIITSLPPSRFNF